MSIKHLFLIAILFPLALITQAQQISVKSFRALPNDMDARQNYPQKDQNGEICAIIKVQSLEKGFYFDIGSLGITKTEQKPGEIWVYVPHGARKITITHDKFLPLRDYFFTESITEGTCYELVLVSGKVVTSVVENEVESQWLIINTEPAGADVYINDAPAGKTPYLGELPVGKCNYRLQKELYLNEAGAVELLAGSQKKKLDVKLKPNFGSIQVSTTPENGSSVVLNGLETGKVTPCTFDKLPIGEHTIIVNHDMYASATKKITLSSGETLPVSIELKPAFAEITLHSEPKADLYVNGQMKANASWQGRLTPGMYTFEAKLDKHSTATEKRTVNVGEPLELTLQPIPKTGTLKVISTPLEASIKLNGKDMGQTPITLKNLLIGDYNVELSLAGYVNHNEKTSISEEQTSTVNATMLNGHEVVINSIPPYLELFIDNKSVGTTEWTGNLAFGDHTLKIQQGEIKAEKNIRVNETETFSEYNLVLTQDFTETAKGLNLDMIFIEGGSFDMGSNDDNSEKPIHTVQLSSFYIGKCEVTQAQWQTVMGTSPSHHTKCDKCPVEQVSYDDVQSFISKLNQMKGKQYSLPTEAQWEYAARGGNKSRGYTYSGSNNIDDVAWYNDNSGYASHPVAQKQHNELGICDMSGNVNEWCSDWYKCYPGHGGVCIWTQSSRVFRGGSWSYLARSCRTTSRNSSTPVYSSNEMGFRLASPE